jgi:hypothetical protein
MSYQESDLYIAHSILNFLWLCISWAAYTVYFLGCVSYSRYHNIDRGLRNTYRQITIDFPFIKTRPPDKLDIWFWRLIEISDSDVELNDKIK